jgi:protein O-GlcNAc transferase
MAEGMDNGRPAPAQLLAAALQHHRAGRFDDAERLYQQLLAIDPGNARALHLRGVLAYQQSRNEAAVDLIGRAIAQNGAEPSFHSNLGLALQACGRLEEAVAAYGRALALDPTLADGHYNLGNALQELGRLDEAVASYAQALALRPDLAEAQCNLGLSLRAQGKLEEAVPCFGQAIALKPNYADAYSSLGNVLVDQGKIDAAQAAYRQALTLDPHHVAAHDALLLSLNYSSEISSEQILAEHRQFEAQHARALLPAQPSHANDGNPDRRLRIGYMSPDFRAHSVAWFLEPVLRAHDRASVELFCYAELARADSVTEIMRPLADHWRVTLGLSDTALAAQIRADAIDILVDLAGHTAGNRLLVFARKPAPVQASWLGYPATTGLAAIDYRIVDAVTDPPGSADRQASETLLRLPGGFLCYRPARDLRAAAAPPGLASGSVTFGSFNNPAKLSGATLDGWARLLARLPHSRLLLKGSPFRDAATRALYLDRLVQRGVAADRIALIGWIADPAAHLTLYERVDIALDTFPYNGTTTSLEALSMGVPVVSLRGDRHAGRVGASLLGQVGLAELVADSVEAYIAIAAELAQKPQQLAALRSSLRSRMLASPLCDTAGFTRTLEAAYRAMWRRWCETRQIEGGQA